MSIYLHQELTRQRHAELIREAEQNRLAGEARRGRKQPETRSRSFSFAAWRFSARRPATA